MELKYERGAYFEENRHPKVRGKVVMDTTDDLHGEPAYLLAEKDEESDEWYSYWQPARQLHDETAEEGVGWCEHTRNLDESKVEQVEEIATPDTPAVPDSPDSRGGQLGDDVTRVRDYFTEAEQEAITNSERKDEILD